MISILIPTYNHNITRLVTDLHQQALETYVDFEIIVVEDGSTLFIEENKTTLDIIESGPEYIVFLGASKDWVTRIKLTK